MYVPVCKSVGVSVAQSSFARLSGTDQWTESSPPTGQCYLLPAAKGQLSGSR